MKSIGPRPLLHRLALDGPLGRGNLAHMAVWAGIFVVMMSTGSADGMHRGDSLPFWEQACAEDRPQACQRLMRIEALVLWRQRGLGLQRAGPPLIWKGRSSTQDPDRAFAYFARACEGRFQAGCVNMLDASTPSPRRSAAARSAVAAARRRTEPARDAGAGALCARLPSWLGVRVSRGRRIDERAFGERRL